MEVATIKSCGAADGGPATRVITPFDVFGGKRRLLPLIREPFVCVMLHNLVGSLQLLEISV